MECKVGYIRGHGFSALEELGLPKRKWQKCCVGTCWSTLGREPVTGGAWCIKTIFIY